jgi:hypothetical protein
VGTYEGLENLGYRHLVVNHNENFIDPDTGANTQYIECMWRYLKANIMKKKTFKL